jgi:hypothetical protein
LRKGELASDANEKRIVKEFSETRERRTHSGLTEPNTLAGPADVALAQEGIQHNEQVEIDVSKVHLMCPREIAASID